MPPVGSLIVWHSGAKRARLDTFHNAIVGRSQTNHFLFTDAVSKLDILNGTENESERAFPNNAICWFTDVNANLIVGLNDGGLMNRRSVRERLFSRWIRQLGDSINISVPTTTVTDASDKKASAGTYTCRPKS